MKFKKVKDCVYEAEMEGDMKVPLRIYATEQLLEKMKEDKCAQQGMNVACLPGIQKYSLMMPDAHQGYGFSIGGVAAMDCKEGCISPGGIGYDINCGVRVLTSNLTKEEIKPKMQELIDNLFRNVPSGVGVGSRIRLTLDELEEVLHEGAHWAVKNGFGTSDDLKHCEENGKLAGAETHNISQRSKARGRKQLGTLGGGNHFCEVQYVEKIFDEKVAKAFGIDKVGQVVVMLHCGSRGFGHQVCSDYLRKMEDTYPELVEKLPEKELAYAPTNSQIAKDYFGAMNAAANFAWANRHVIGHQIRKAFERSFDNVELKTLYDIAHNIAKKEKYTIDGVEKEVFVHRKGATRAFGPGRPEIPEDYREFGQPVLIPGSMGTASYILVGTNENMNETFGSSAHGAGRNMSRHAAIKKFGKGDEVKKKLAEQEIMIKAASWKGIVEEAPEAYKDVDEVVKTTDTANIGNIVARLKPMGVIKG